MSLLLPGGCFRSNQEGGLKTCTQWNEQGHKRGVGLLRSLWIREPLDREALRLTLTSISADWPRDLRLTPWFAPLPAGGAPPNVDPEAYSWFQSVDSDHSGYISVKELKQALVNSNWSTFNDETCLMMISEYQPFPVGSGSGQSHRCLTVGGWVTILRKSV